MAQMTDFKDGLEQNRFLFWAEFYPAEFRENKTRQGEIPGLPGLKVETWGTRGSSSPSIKSAASDGQRRDGLRSNRDVPFHRRSLAIAGEHQLLDGQVS